MHEYHYIRYLYDDHIARISFIMAPFVVSSLEVITIKYVCLMWDFPERTESYTSMLLSEHLYFLQRMQNCNSVLFEHHFMTWLFCAGVEGPLQRRLQQLLLYMRCLQLLSQTLDYARTELKAKRLKPSTTVKNTLGKRKPVCFFIQFYSHWVSWTVKDGTNRISSYRDTQN